MSRRKLTGDDRYLTGGALQDHLREPGSDHLPYGDGEKFRQGWDRMFGTNDEDTPEQTQETE